MDQNALAAAFNQWTTWRWAVLSCDSYSLVLAADIDLTYHHSVEIAFDGVVYVACPTEFDSPIAREIDRHARVLANQFGDGAHLTPFCWRSETAPRGGADCLVIAESVRIAEGHWTHQS